MSTSAQFANFKSGAYNPSYFSPETSNLYEPVKDVILGLELSETDVLGDPALSDALETFWASYRLDKAEKEGKQSVSTPSSSVAKKKVKAKSGPSAPALPMQKPTPKPKPAPKPKTPKPKPTAKTPAKKAAKPAPKRQPASKQNVAMSTAATKNLKKVISNQAERIDELRTMLKKERSVHSITKKLLDQDEAKVKKIHAIANPKTPTTSGKPRPKPSTAKVTKKADQVRRISTGKGTKKSTVVSRLTKAKRKVK